MRRLYAEPCLSSSVGSKISQNRSGSAWPLQIGRCSATRSGFSSNASRSITTKSTSSSVSRPHRHRYRPSPREVGVCKIVGGVISPLLANLYMRRFVLGWMKLALEQHLGSRLVTYAYDLVIKCLPG